MDNEKKDFRKLYEDLVHSDWFKRAYHDKSLGVCPFDIPELREINEDEVRKDLIGGLMWQRDNLKSEGPHDNNLILPGFCLTVGKHLAYLEKQEESLQRPESCKENADSLTSEDERIRKGLIDMFKRHPFCEINGLKTKDIVSWLEKQKEQKPVEKQDYSGLTDFERAIHRGFLCAGVENVPVTIIKETAQECLAQMKPVEWSEEDEEMLEYIIGDVNDAKQLYTTQEAKDMADKEIAWLEKQKEQKPNSTEDMPYITDEHFYEREPADSFKYKLAEYMTKCCTKKEGPYGYEYGISAESILKMAEEELLKRGVVQKPVEWSEEDEEMLEYIISDVNDAKQLYTTQEAKDMADKEIAWLKSLRPHWEPSGVQMSALLAVLNDPDNIGSQTCQLALSELYDDLNKL